MFGFYILRPPYAKSDQQADNCIHAFFFSPGSILRWKNHFSFDAEGISDSSSVRQVVDVDRRAHGCFIYPADFYFDKKDERQLQRKQSLELVSLFAKYAATKIHMACCFDGTVSFSLLLR